MTIVEEYEIEMPEFDTDVPVEAVVNTPVIYDYRSLVDQAQGLNQEPQAIIRDGYLASGHTLDEVMAFFIEAGVPLSDVTVEYDGTIAVKSVETAEEAAERFAMVSQRTVQVEANLYGQYLALLKKFEPDHMPVDCSEEVAVILHQMRETREAIVG